MFDVNVNISLNEVITGLLLYAIIHGIYKIANLCLKRLGTEASHIINQHVKAGHKSRFKRCIEDDCAARPETATGWLHLPG